MTSSYPTIKHSHDQLLSVRTKPIYVGLFLGAQIGFAAICGNQTIAIELLKAALGPQIRTAMLLWAIAAVVVVVARNNLKQDYSIPNALLYVVRIPYDLFVLTLGSLIAMFVVFLAHGIMVGAIQCSILVIIFLAGIMSFAALSILVLSVNFAASNLREGFSRIIRERQLRIRYFAVIVLGVIGMSGEYLYRLLSQWFS